MEDIKKTIKENFMKIKRYHNKKNIAGMVIRNALKQSGMTKAELCRKLELEGVAINRDELLLMEKNKLMIKDFELVAIYKILKVDLNVLKRYIA